jgi:signal transduction histidine kinase
MTVYLLGLLAVTLAVVWVVIDQVTARALAAREADGVELIQANHKERCRAERERIDQALLQQAKDLGNIMQNHYGRDAEITNYRRLADAVHVTFVSVPFAEFVSPLGWITRPGPGPSPSIFFRTYFANLPLPEEDIRHFDDESRSIDFFQVNTVAGREWHSQSLASRTLPFDPKEFDSKPAEPSRPGEAPNLIDWVYRDSNLAQDGEPVRRVLYKATLYSRYSPGFRRPGPGGGGGPDRGGGFGGPAPRSMLGAWTQLAVTGFGPPPAGVLGGTPAPSPVLTLESLPRLYIQCARPKAAIDAVMAQFAADRDDELARLAGEIRTARSTLRSQIAGIGLIAFLALAVGGPLLVSRALRPVGKLSEAVSRVSEKDFRLPHDGTDLAVELAPIHARLTQTLDLLQRAFAREKQAVADISHELRTPIAALMATIDVALRKPRTSEQYREALEECRLISKQLGQLVERIMTLASLDAGNDCLQVARTDAAELATGCAAVIRPLAAAGGLTVDLQAESPLELDTDAGKLREVLMNLLHNAVEYNRPGGTIELSACRDNGSVVFEVRDTGIGMSPEVKEKIFERFYRADASRHATGIHAGLGLAIVKEYVARLHGTIAVETQPGVGSKFRVTLPAPLPADTAPRSVPAEEPVIAGS